PGCYPALAFTSLSRDGEEVDGGDKPGHGLDGTDRPLSDRLTNGRAECKRFPARPNVQARRRSAPTRPVQRQPRPRISAVTAMGFAAIVTAAPVPAYEIRAVRVRTLPFELSASANLAALSPLGVSMMTRRSLSPDVR